MVLRLRWQNRRQELDMPSGSQMKEFFCVFTSGMLIELENAGIICANK